MSTASCIDISHWQGFPNFETVRTQGVVACIMKATEGTTYVDPNRATNFVNATNAGIACCCYMWLKPSQDAAAQANFFLQTVQPVDGERVVIDWEETPLSVKQLCDAVTALNDYGKNLQVTIYCSQSPLMSELGNAPDDVVALLSETDLWVARYTSASDPGQIPTQIWPTWSLWQYSESGVVDGISDSNVDLNEFNGSDDELVAWMSPAGVQPQPVPPPVVEQVTVDITAPSSVHVVVYVNDMLVQTRHRFRPPRKGDVS